jgi:putative flippase GtrA
MIGRIYSSIMKKTHNVFLQFIRYGFSALIAVIADIGILYVLTLFDFFKYYYVLAASISVTIAIITNYLISVKWVFQNRNVKNKKIEFLIFIFIGFIGFGLNALIIWIFTDFVFSNHIAIIDKQERIMVSKVISTVIVYFWNFFAKKYVLFK